MAREQHPQAAVGDDLLNLRAAEQRIDRNGDEAGPQCGEVGDHELDAVRPEDPDPVPRDQAMGGGAGGDRVDLVVELAPGPGAAFRLRLDHGDGVRPCVRLG